MQVKMVRVLARLSVVIVLWIVRVSASKTCPSYCYCFLEESPITVNCSGLSLNNLPADVDTRVSSQANLKESSKFHSSSVVLNDILVCTRQTN